jgi:Kef-type K+ transport system membrane component KefB
LTGSTWSRCSSSARPPSPSPSRSGWRRGSGCPCSRSWPARLAGLGFVASLAVALGAGSVFAAAGLAGSPLFLAIVLVATSLGIVVPVLKDAGEIPTPFGQLLVAAGSIADFGAIILLTLLFSREATGTATKLLRLGSFALLAAAVLLGVAGAERWRRLSDTLARLQDTTAQIRVRGAFALLVGLSAVAGRLGLEVILGAFVAGAVLSLADRDRAVTHRLFRGKLEAVGYGIFIPVFFVTSGVRFDLDALTESGSTLARVPLFLLALLAVRGLPTLLYRGAIGPRRTAAAALLQSTSLPFVVAATQIGLELGTVSEANAAALVGAGILSVLLFPPGALTVLRGPAERAQAARVEPEPAR